MFKRTVSKHVSNFPNSLILPCTRSLSVFHEGVNFCLNIILLSHTVYLGAQWLSGRVLDSRPKGRGFEPHRRHCVVVLEQDTFIVA